MKKKWIRKVPLSLSVWMESDVNLTTLEPLMATKRYSNANYATLIDLLDLLTYQRIKISFTEE